MPKILIDAMEHRYVAVFNAPGAYLCTDIKADKYILLRIRYQFVDIICEVNTDYKTYVKCEIRKKVLYVKVLRAIYGCIESSLLWYNLYVKSLKHLVFSIKTYDIYVFNKMIDEKKYTIVWYVDDNKLLHVDPNMVTDILEVINNHSGDLVISRGDTHDFLGMTIKIRKDKEVELMIKHQIEETVRKLKDI